MARLAQDDDEVEEDSSKLRKAERHTRAKVATADPMAEAAETEMAAGIALVQFGCTQVLRRLLVLGCVLGRSMSS